MRFIKKEDLIEIIRAAPLNMLMPSDASYIVEAYGDDWRVEDGVWQLQSSNELRKLTLRAIKESRP